MKRIIVIGCPGSGKSTFSRTLRDITGIPLYHLDRIFWKKDRSTISKHEFDRKLSEIMNRESWIIDGNYSRTIEMRLEKCDTVFFLDYPVDICLQGVRSRIGQKRSDIPWVETDTDAEFLEFVENFSKTERPKILERLSGHPDVVVYRFTSRAQADQFLKDRGIHL